MGRVRIFCDTKNERRTDTLSKMIARPKVKFLEKLEEGKNEDPNYKLSKDDFCDCFC